MTNPKVWATVGEPNIKKPVEIPTTWSSETVHVFETSGLGKAPYVFLGVEERRGPLTLADGTQVGAPGQPMGCCQYCSTGIAYLFWLRSADKKKFFVGSDCIFKSGDAGLRRIIDPIVAEHQKQLREDREKELVNKFQDYLALNPTYWQDANKGPHPYEFYARQGKTLGDYKKFSYEHSGHTGRAKIARQCLIGLGLEQPHRTRAAKDKK